jgi:hypothetical protein
MQLDSEADDRRRVGLWLLKTGSTEMASSLLPVALNAKTLRHAALVLHVNLAAPCKISSTLTEWVGLLQQHMVCEGAGAHGAGLARSELDALQKRVEALVRRKARRLIAGPVVRAKEVGEAEHVVEGWQEGVGEEDELGGRAWRTSLEDEEDELGALPLPEGVLSSSESLQHLFPSLRCHADLNLGVPILVVASNAQALEPLPDAHEAHVLRALRTVALAIGAALLVANGQGGDGEGGTWRVETARQYLDGVLFEEGLVPEPQVELFVRAQGARMKSLRALVLLVARVHLTPHTRHRRCHTSTTCKNNATKPAPGSSSHLDGTRATRSTS